MFGYLSGNLHSSSNPLLPSRGLAGVDPGFFLGGGEPLRVYHFYGVSKHNSSTPSQVFSSFFFCRIPVVLKSCRSHVFFNTNKPQSFFLQNTSCIRKLQVIISGWGGRVRTPPASFPLDPHLRIQTLHLPALTLKISFEPKCTESII